VHQLLAGFRGDRGSVLISGGDVCDAESVAGFEKLERSLAVDPKIAS